MVAMWSAEVDAVAAGAPDARLARSWLLESGSITARLRQAWPSVQVRVVWAGVDVPHASDAWPLEVHSDTDCWVRDVQLHAHGRVLVSARTVVPDWAPGHPWQSVATLGDRPLADVLFGQAGLVRSAHAFALLQRATGPVPARRCRYTCQGATLWLTEAFDWLAHAPAQAAVNGPT